MPATIEVWKRGTREDLRPGNWRVGGNRGINQGGRVGWLHRGSYGDESLLLRIDDSFTDTESEERTSGKGTSYAEGEPDS
jgi:hypothetical protein